MRDISKPRHVNNMGVPESITVVVRYDTELQKITRVASETVVVSTNCVFIFLLQTIFECYPAIPKRYPPGSIYMFLNNKGPSEFDILSDGDSIHIGAAGTPQRTKKH